MRLSKLTFCFLIFLCALMKLNAATYYVATTGSDTNNGSISAPFKTFDKAVAVMTAGDECIIRAGVYRQTLTISKNGTSESPYTFRAMDGEEVIVKATEYVNNWELHEGAVYKATVNTDLGDYNQVYEDDQLMQFARWPNDTDGDRFTIDAKEVTDQGTATSIITSGLPNVDLSGAMLWYLGGHTGTSWTRPTTGITATEISYAALPDKWPFNTHNPTVWRSGGKYGRYYLYNKLSLLDQGKEWFYDTNANTLYFQNELGGLPADNTVEVPVRLECAVITGDYVVIDGIQFFGGRVKIDGEHVVFKNNKLTHGLERFDSVTNESAQISEGSLEIKGDHTVIENNTIEQGSLSGIFIISYGQDRGKDTRIEKNTIRYFDAVGIHASPIRATSSGVKILKNLISHGGRDGVYVSSTDCEVAYNDISRSQLINDDSGVFYTVGNDFDKNTEVHHNWIHDATSPSYSNQKAAGIYLDNDSKGFLVHHNVVWNVTWTGFQLNWANWNNNIYHNTILNVGDVMGTWVNGYEQKDNNIWNNYTDTPDWLTEPGFDHKDNILDENVLQIEDIVAMNFMPIEGSTLIDAADIIEGFDKVYHGASPDVGAYEYEGVMWTAGIDAVEDVELVVKASSQPDAINFDDLENPTIVNSNVAFQIEITGLDETETYNLYNQLNNETSGVQVSGFSKTNITGVTSLTVDVNWNYFPNNPLVTNLTDTFEWQSNLFLPGTGKVGEVIVTNLDYNQSLSLDTPDSILDKVTIYPMPTSGEVYIDGVETSTAKFTILDMKGAVIRHSKNFSNLQSGIYFLKIETEEFICMKKVLVK